MSITDEARRLVEEHHIQKLLGRGVYYAWKYISWGLAAHSLHDMIVGSSVEPKNPHYLYTDFHVHIHRKTDLKAMIQEAAKRVDIFAITGRTADAMFDNHHTFDTFQAQCLEERIPHETLGENVSVFDVNGKPLYVLRATEIYPKQMLGVVAVGGKLERTYYHGQSDLGEVVSDAKDNTPFVFFDHPFSIPAPLIFFRYPTEKEIDQRIDWIVKYQVAIETGNHQNTWWMVFSNSIAQDIAERYDFVGIANSDTHFRIKEVGLSRTRIPRASVSTENEERFLESLHTAFSHRKKEDIQPEPGYSSTWSFGNYMFLSTLSSRYRDAIVIPYNF